MSRAFGEVLPVCARGRSWRSLTPGLRVDGARLHMDGNTVSESGQVPEPAGWVSAGVALVLAEHQGKGGGEKEPAAAGGGLSPSHIGPVLPAATSGAVVRWARGGAVVAVKLPGTGQVGGGIRGEVTRFSEQSRRRMMTKMNSIDRRQVVPLGVWFGTMTYPDQFPHDPRQWKAHLKAFRKRLVRRYGLFPVVWRMEFQERKSGTNKGRVAPHFHLVFIVPGEMIANIREFREWMSRAWYEVVDSGDERHLRAGTNCIVPGSWRGAMGYVSKYVGKQGPSYFDAETGEVSSVGRIWGVWFEEGLPVVWEEEEVTLEEAYRFRRLMWRRMRWKSWARRTGVTIFLPDDFALKGIAWILAGRKARDG